MGNIYVQKTGCNSALSLPCPYGADIELVPIEEIPIVKSFKADQDIGRNQDNGR